MKCKMCEEEVHKNNRFYEVELCSLICYGRKSREDEIIEIAKKFNGMIETIDDLFKHLDRVSHCSSCKRTYWDMRCPDCAVFNGETKNG